MKYPQQKFNLHQVVDCQTVRGIESVVVYDAQRRSTDYAYLVVNQNGLMFVAWPNHRTYGQGRVQLVQMSKIPVGENPNVDVKGKCFKYIGYVPC